MKNGFLCYNKWYTLIACIHLCACAYGILPTAYPCNGFGVYTNIYSIRMMLITPIIFTSISVGVHHTQKKKTQTEQQTKQKSSSTSSCHCSHDSWTYAHTHKSHRNPSMRSEWDSTWATRGTKEERNTSLNTCFGDVKYFRGRVTVITSGEPIKQGWHTHTHTRFEWIFASRHNEKKKKNIYDNNYLPWKI